MTKTRRNQAQPLFEAKHGAPYCTENGLCVECGHPLTGRQKRWCGQGCVDAYLIRKGGNEARKAVFRRDRGLCFECGLDTNAIREAIKSADKTAFAAYLKEWNAENPEGIRGGSYLDARKYCDQGYKPYWGPKTYTGYKPGGRWSAKPSSTWRTRFRLWELVKAHRLGVFKALGLERMEAWWWRKTYWDADHVVGIAEGGGGCGLNNLQTLCLCCHVKKSAKATRNRNKRGRKLERMRDEKCTDECRLNGPEHELCLGCLRFRKRVLRRTG